ncbi:MAG: DEAD/DEAH box helicase [bacterium]
MSTSFSIAVSHNFEEGIRRRGNEYFRSRRVSLKNGSTDAVTATVHGHGRYDIYLRWVDEDLIAGCTCPYFHDVDLCKHVWAVVLAADSEGYLLPLRTPKPVIFPEDEYDEFIAEDEAPLRTIPGGMRTSQPAPPAWRSTLDLIRSQTSHPQSAASPKERALAYHLMAFPSSHAPTLAVKEQTRKKNGEWSKPKAFRTDGTDISALADPVDREIVTLLHGIVARSVYGGWQRPELAGLTPTQPMWDVLFPLLGRSNRFFLLRDNDNPVGPLSFDDGPPWHLRVTVNAPAGSEAYRVTGSLHREHDVRDLAESFLVLRDGWVIWKDSVSRFQAAGSFGWVKTLRASGHLAVPEKDLAGFMEQVYILPSRPPITWPEGCGIREVQEPPQKHLALEPCRTSSSVLLGALRFQYGDQSVATNAPGSGVMDKAKKCFHLRDVQAEKAAASELKRLGFGPSYLAYGNDHTHTLGTRLAGRAIPGLIAAGWHVTGRGKLYRSSTFTEVRVTSGVDWFDLEGGAKYGDEEVPLPVLLRALREGTGYVVLGDGTMGLLPEEWLNKIGLATALGVAAGDHIRIDRQRASLLDVLLAELPDVRADETFERVRAELRDFQRIEPADPPAGFQGRLRDYQRDGLGWFQFLRRFGFGGCLADDMGLGKTVQVLALLEHRRTAKPKDATRKSATPSLVVAPKSLIFNWIEEAKRFTPKLRVFDHTGLERARSGKDFKKAGVVLTTYGTLRRDIAWLKDVKFDYVVLDEAQAVKNSTTQNAKAVRLLQGAHRLALSGTPIENHLGELWSLFGFLNPGMLGGAGVLKQFSSERAEADDKSRALLARALRPFILRRTKSQVAKELPARTENTLHCDLPEAQRKLYDELKEHYRRSLLGKVKEQGIGRSKIQILEALLRLRQAACHPALLGGGHAFKDDGAKLTALIPQLQEVVEEGHKALVFSQFTSFLALVKERLDAEKLVYEYLDGKTRDRQARVERFQTDPACGIFLISLKAGGQGLNLTAAEYVFLLDPWWNPAVEAQAIDRAHRIGQTRNVFAYRLIARDTIEDKILELQAKKRNLADSIIMADDSLLRTLTRKDLEVLLA